MQLVQAEYPTPDHVLVHVSDPHFVAEGLLYGEMDPRQGLVEVLDAIEASGIGPEAIVFSGDLTDKGSPEAYRQLRSICDSYAARMDTRIIWAMGNHDERENFQRLMLDQAPQPGPVDRRYDLGGLRVLVLDSSKPGVHHGEISGDQLRWLADELQTPADDGTLLVLHHPPVPPVQDLAVLSELRNQHALAEVLEGSDVVGILSGHTHCSLFSSFANIPVSVASATSYTQDLALPPAAMQGRNGARSFNLVRLHGRTFVSAVVPVGTYAAFGEHVTAEETARRLEAAGVAIPPQDPKSQRRPSRGAVPIRRSRNEGPPMMNDPLSDALEPFSDPLDEINLRLAVAATDIAELRAEVARLERELEESRRLNVQAAELLKLVYQHVAREPGAGVGDAAKSGAAS